MSYFTDYAKRELEFAGLNDSKKDFYEGETGKAVMELIETFAKQGHSGMSASVVSGIFLNLYKTKKLGSIEDVKKKLEDAGTLDPKTDFYGGHTGKSVMELAEVFIKQEHTNASAHIVCSIFDKLTDYLPITPLKGTDDEWGEVVDGDLLQNVRCPAVFKKKKDGMAFYLDAIVWHIKGTSCTYTGKVEGVTSEQFIEFPFVPKTFIIEVTNDRTDENSEAKIIDREQLVEAFDYFRLKKGTVEAEPDKKEETK